MVFANNFLAGSLISLLIPAAVLVSIAVWYTRTVLRLARTRRDSTGDAAGTPSTLRPDSEPPATGP